MTKRYYIIFNLIVLTAIIYTAVNIIYKTTLSQVTPVYTDDPVKGQTHDVIPHEKYPLSNFAPITDRNLFGSVEKASKKNIEGKFENIEPTSLNLILLGTVSGDQKSARAIIEETGKRKQAMYKVGDSIQDAVVDQILRKDVILKVGGNYEKLSMKDPALTRASSFPERRSRDRRLRSSPGTTAKGTTITVKRKDIQASLGNLNELLTQVRIQPHYKEGKADGLTISRIKRGSIFSRLGMRNGDIIQQINGKSLNSPEEIYNFYEELKSGSQASLQISRRGRPKTFNYRFR